MIRNLLEIRNSKFKILSLVILVVLLFPLLTTAQDITASASVSVSPTLFELDLKPGDVSVSSMKVINLSNKVQSYEMEIKPFVGNELGEAKIVPDDDPAYSLGSWVKINPEKFSLAPSASQEVKFTVSVPKDAEPGGKYGSVLATLSDKGEVSSGTGAVTRSKVGSLVLVAIAGEINYAAYVKDFSVTQRRYEKSPVTFTTRLHNDSTVHIKPKGFITLTNIFGSQAAQMNFEQKNILPNSDRLLTQAYDQPLPIGRYKASLNLVYGTGQTLAAQIVFYVLPLWLIILAAIALGLFVQFLIYRRRQQRQIAELLKAARKVRVIRRMG